MDTTRTDVSSDHFAIIKMEYDAATESLTPTSRSTLARRLTEKTGIPHKTAVQVVDSYCEQNGVPIPEYLGREFNVGWLKVVSVFLVLLAVGFCIYGRNLHVQHIAATWVWVVCALLLGCAVLSWVKSLEAEADNVRQEKVKG